MSSKVHLEVRSAIEAGETIPVALIESLIALCEAQQEQLAALHGTGKVGEVARQVSVMCQLVRHELANPLTVVAGSLEIAASGRLDREKEIQLLQRATTQVRRMWEFLDNVSDFATSPRALMPREQQESVRLRDLVEEAVVLASESLEPERVQIDVPIDLTLWTVPSRLLQIVTNLLVNAGKYTPPGSPVRASAWRNHDDVMFTVDDRGPGIPAELEEAVFEPLVRGVLSSDVPGRGLGLYLARAFARSLKAELDLLARAGGGTTARITIPQRRVEDHESS